MPALDEKMREKNAKTGKSFRFRIFGNFPIRRDKGGMLYTFISSNSSILMNSKMHHQEAYQIEEEPSIS